ncbi:sporulation protein Cse60 [Niallia sp. NCCP-28]|uniref:sporulation protein Cse60 n=1 Tax=Niallia sp. NCCP-28 TaxID=2934712 RepID=UPI0020869101|nr:sporulation protein Cse60 [Niallia sp. NCCP-28]GKU82918.1 hypothetical protein NCCP28_23140 [Niallia sp. NCCP-28]
MIQTRIITEYYKDLQKSLNQELKELREREIVDIKFVVNNEPITEKEYYTAMIMYKA